MNLRTDEQNLSSLNNRENKLKKKKKKSTVSSGPEGHNKKLTFTSPVSPKRRR